MISPGLAAPGFEKGAGTVVVTCGVINEAATSSAVKEVSTRALAWVNE